MTPPRLFTGTPLANVFNDTTTALLTAAANLPAKAWQANADGSARDPAADLAARAVLTVPVFDWSALTTRVGETTVMERTNSPEAGQRRDTSVIGVFVSVSVPFAGSAVRLSSRPSLQYIGGCDSTVSLRGGRLIDITKTGRHVFAGTIQAHVGHVKADLARYLDRTTTDLATWRTSLIAALRYEVDARAALLAEFGTLTTELAPSD